MIPGSDALIRRLPTPATSEAVYWHPDVPGLHLRILASGARTWRFQYRIGGRLRRLTLGSPGAVTLVAAVAAARRHAGRVAAGFDPAMERDAARAEAAAESFDAAAERYLAARAVDMRPGALDQIQRHLRLYAKPLHGTPVPLLTVRDVVSMLDRVARESGAVTSNRTRASIAAFLRWLAGRGEVASNLVFDVRLIPRRPEVSRDRVLSWAELQAIWSQTASGTAFDRIVRLLMLTGCRRSEIGSLRVDEVGEAWIVIPPGRTKTQVEHPIPRLPAIDALLSPMPEQGYIFGEDPDQPFSGWNGGLSRLRARVSAVFAEQAEAAGVEAEPVPGWGLHDLRRTLSTRMNDAHLAPPAAVEALLGHAVAGIAGVYDRGARLQLRRDALVAWHRLLVEHGVPVEG